MQFIANIAIAQDKGDLHAGYDGLGGEAYPRLSSTAVLQGSLIGSSAGAEFIYEAVDSHGRRYDAYINTVTGEVAALSSDLVVANVLSSEQLSAVRAKYEASGSPAGSVGLALPIVLVPIIGGAMCYINDQITKARAHKDCAAQGQTVVMKDSGICGMGANYRCEINPTPRPQPEPLPQPGPGPDPRVNEFGWTLPGSSNFNSQHQLVVNTYDDDWF